MNDTHNTAVFDSRLDPQLAARNLYWQGWKISEIAKNLGVRAPTVYSWKQRGNWDGGSPVQRVAASAEARLIQLLNVPKKSDGDYKEIKNLYQLIDGSFSAKGKGAQQTANLGTCMPDVPSMDKPPQEQKEGGRLIIKRGKPAQNQFEPGQIKRMQEIFQEQMFDYQRHWWEIGKKMRWREILKSRQIGATFFFAREAFIDALITGKDKVFLSASRAQAFQFKQYMIDLAAMVDVELKGENIVLPNSGAKLHFLGTNSRTAQGRHGDLYVDEYFWIPDFVNLRKLASPMASQKQFKMTYFSTPSDESHAAFPYWSGDHFNKDRPKSSHIKLDVSPHALAQGRLDPDGKWRQIVTLDVAEAGGCTLFDRQQLELEYSPTEFRQLFMCEFMKGGDSVFELDLLLSCAVDVWDKWEDEGGFYTPFIQRPVGHEAVWVSLDPTESGDAAGLVVAMAPRFNGDAFRILETRLLHVNSYEEQAAAIKELFQHYHVTKVVIDANSIGTAVVELVQKFFPTVVSMRYTPEIKALMVHKTMSLFKHKRIEYPAENKDFQISFMGIRRQQTASGRQVTYVSGRSQAASHCDIAWAALGLFYQEPFDGNVHSQSEFEVL